MFWQDFVHLTKMEFFLKYWYIYAVMILFSVLYSIYEYKQKKKENKQWQELFKDRMFK